jgi:hypothetical protein
MVTRNPRATNKRPNDAQMIPFPKDDVTPPVTKMYLVDIWTEGLVDGY